MSSTAPSDAQALAAWLAVLDDLTHYALLGVEPGVSAGALKQAFHAFAGTFHPDEQRARDPDEHGAVTLIFTRANEAYRVLGDPHLRERYDALLAAGIGAREAAQRSRSAPPAPASTSEGPKRLEDRLRSPSARPFARRAAELVDKGDFKQARLQLTLARHHEPENDALTEYLRELDAREHDAKSKR